MKKNFAENRMLITVDPRFGNKIETFGSDLDLCRAAFLAAFTTNSYLDLANLLTELRERLDHENGVDPE